MGIVAGTLRARRLEEGLRTGLTGADEVALEVTKHPELLRRTGLLAPQQQRLVHVAAAAGNAEVLRCLLAAAADVAARGGDDSPCAAARRAADAPNARGQTPLMLAAGAPGGGAEACVRLLLDAGADPWSADSCGGRTALFYAACADEVGAVAALLEATEGASIPAPAFPNSPGTRYVDARMLLGFSALHVAVAADARAALRVLLRAGPRLFAPTLFASYDFIVCARGTCPLHLAARHNRPECAKMLLIAHAQTQGIDPRVLLDDLNRLPCQVATVHGHTDVARLLQPGVPLAQLLGGGSAGPSGLYLAGPPALKLLAAAALRAHQEATLKSARAALGLAGGDAAGAFGGAGARCHRGHGQRLHSALSCDPVRGHAHPKAAVFDFAGSRSDDGGSEEPATPMSGAVLFGSGCGNDNGCSTSASALQLAAGPAHGAPGCGCGCGSATDSDAGSETGDGDGCCGICLDAEPAVALRPCQHALCADCCGRLFTMNHANVVACPFCRATVGSFAPAPAC